MRVGHRKGDRGQEGLGRRKGTWGQRVGYSRGDRGQEGRTQ
jgi:hypothetical protein